MQSLLRFEPAHQVRRWLSAHLHFSGPTIYDVHADAIALTFVAPLVTDLRARGLVQRFFYIRYSESGWHIRLRLLGMPDDLERHVKPAISASALGFTPVLEATGPPPDVGAGYAATATATAPIRVLWVPYEPETERYGGPHAIAIAEALFESSSDAAIALLATMKPTRASRLGKALLGMVVALHAFAQDRMAAAQLCTLYGRSYLPALTRQMGADEPMITQAFQHGYEAQAATLADTVCSAWDALDSRDSLSPSLDEYHRRLTTHREELAALQRAGLVLAGDKPVNSWPQCVNRLLPSFIHMMNNRLGVTIPEEAYLAMILSRALTDAATANH